MLGKVNEGYAGITDINRVEFAALFPLAAMVMWVGIAPDPFVAMLSLATGHLVGI